jgi:hypothetical protein
MGNTELSDAIDDAQWRNGIAPQSVGHFLFTFSDNAPDRYLASSLRTYSGTFPQLYVGLRIEGHAMPVLKSACVLIAIQITKQFAPNSATSL